MTSRRTSATLASQWLRRRLLWTAVLLLICLGGAGLATAVDRPATQAARPELSRAADRAAAPWLEELEAALRTLDGDVSALSGAARRVLVEVSALAGGRLESSVAAGDAIAERLLETHASAVALRESPAAGVEPWRLGQQNLERLALVDGALVAAGGLPALWREIADRGRLAAALLETLAGHDELALAGVRAGTESRWADAVAALEAALGELERVAGVGQALRGPDPGQPLDELLAAHRRHDEALLALYRYMAEGGSLDDARATDLRAGVEAARLPLPTPTATLQEVTAGVAGPALSEGLSAIEEARASILEALGPPAEALGPPGEGLGPPAEALGAPDEALGPPGEGLGASGGGA